MAKSEKQLTTKVTNGSPYQLDPSQVAKATTALISHLAKDSQSRAEGKGNKSLLDDQDADGYAAHAVPVWLILGTKKHIQDKKRLKPSKIPLPHPISSPTSRVCLITADPQRAYKDLIADPKFPSSTSSKIPRVLGLSKLKARYKTFESRRQLLAEYDVFLADDRVITFLPGLLGKIFYSGTSKRPVPVNLLAGLKPDKDAQKKKKKQETEQAKVGAPEAVARDIEAALGSALVNVSPSTTTAVRVANSTMTPQQIGENVQEVVRKLTEKFVPKGWRGVRSFHIKGPETMSLPIWLADELWEEDQDVQEEKPQSSAESIPRGIAKKRKREDNAGGKESKVRRGAVAR